LRPTLGRLGGWAGESVLPRLNPSNYEAEFSGWRNGANLNLRFASRVMYPPFLS
jgi:hypothetical protein